MARTHVWWNTKGPKSTPKEELTEGRVRIKQVRSGIGHSWRMRATLQALGLRKHQSEVVLQDSPALRGQIKRVRHLVEVSPVGETEAQRTESSGRVTSEGTEPQSKAKAKDQS